MACPQDTRQCESLIDLQVHVLLSLALSCPLPSLCLLLSLPPLLALPFLTLSSASFLSPTTAFLSCYLLVSSCSSLPSLSPNLSFSLLSLTLSSNLSVSRRPALCVMVRRLQRSVLYFRDVHGILTQPRAKLRCAGPTATGRLAGTGVSSTSTVAWGN